MKANVSFSESNEVITAVKIDVWVNGTHRGQVVVGGDVRSYLIENLGHTDTVWVEVTYVDVAGNESKSERLVFQALDTLPPAQPIVTLVSIEQV